MKKTWNNPSLSVIGIEKTRAGNGTETPPDAVYDDGTNTWYSYPDNPS